MGYKIGDYFDFSEFFDKQILDPPPIGSIIKYNDARTKPYYKHIIFVEGCTDKIFYSNTNIDTFKDNAYYIYSTKKENAEYVGKEGVFHAYHSIQSDNALLDDFEKCIFIIDRDWDERIVSENHFIKKYDIPSFTVTFGHSMENYFLELDNLKIIFDMYHIQDDYDYFANCYIQYVNETADYWAYKATLSYAKKEKLFFSYKKDKSFEDIFDFRYIDNKIIYNKDFYNSEVELMKSGINYSLQLMDKYELNKEKIINEPRFVRGHDAFRYLKVYLKEKHGIDFDFWGQNEKLFKMIISKLNVNIDVKTQE